MSSDGWSGEPTNSARASKDNNPWHKLAEAMWDHPTTSQDPRDDFNFTVRQWPEDSSVDVTEEHTGGSSSYYQVKIEHPRDTGYAYTAECIDIIQALDMTFDEGNVFKACWRKAAQRQGKCKKGSTALYDAEKIEFFGASMVRQETNK